MFEFIVSGYVPGTHFQVTLNWVLIFILVGLVVFEAVKIMKRHHMTLSFNLANVLLSSSSAKAIRRKKAKSEQLELL